jgi:predicted enzyme related to lactoylglutathione lyase
MKLRIALIVTALLGGIAACTTTGQADLSGVSFSKEPLTGKVIWNDLITEDLASARQFYGGLFGWTFEDAEAQGGGEYVVARDGDTFVAGLRSVEARADGTKVTRWLPYMSVDDVDAAIDRGKAGGATVVVGARDVNLGRVAAIVDPEGAVLGIARSSIGDPDDRTTAAAPGRVVWSELLSSDPVAASAFYRLLAGLDIEIVERRGGLYTMLTNGGVKRAGIMPRPADDIDPVWLTYFGVSDPRAAAAKAEELGGTVLLPPSPELREGTMAVVTDPVGAVLVLQKVPM